MDILLWNFGCFLLTHRTHRVAFKKKNMKFSRNWFSEIVKNAFSSKIINLHTNFSLLVEEHVLIVLGGEVMTFVLQPLFRFLKIVKDWNATESLEFQAKEKYRGVFEIQKSGDKTSSGEIGLDIRTHASPNVGQDQVSGGVSVLCWHAAPVAYVLWKPCTIR